ncbi:MAG: L,D-transpeptidase [Candidatus Margulisbacteria bacterium]|nr:L,D-transpeptidase [Candidatus Margulisiibacteriota bacterium]
MRNLVIRLIILLIIFFITSYLLFGMLVSVYFRRNLAYLTMQDRLEVYESARRTVDSSAQQLKTVITTTAPRHDRPYLVISIAEHKLWLKEKGTVLFSAPVATSSEKKLVNIGGANIWKFETPRGRLVIQDKEEAPVWVPPDWHYVEQARKRGLGLVYLGQPLKLSDGSIVRIEGSEVVRIFADGKKSILQATAKKDIVLDGNLLVPPVGTSQRRYKGVLGPYSLELGDGYAIHGTDQPESIGQAVSHGCVRLRNEDIARLYPLVPTGTPVYIY